MARNVRNKHTLAQQAEAEAFVVELEESLTTHVANANPHSVYALDTDLTTHAGASDPHTGYRLESVAITAAMVASDVATQAELESHLHTIRSAAEVPSGAPTGTEMPLAYDTTAVTGGTYIWIGAAWVKIATIL